jgi:hypothetical protein
LRSPKCWRHSFQACGCECDRHILNYHFFETVLVLFHSYCSLSWIDYFIHFNCTKRTLSDTRNTICIITDSNNHSSKHSGQMSRRSNDRAFLTFILPDRGARPKGDLHRLPASALLQPHRLHCDIVRWESDSLLRHFSTSIQIIIGILFGQE